MPLPRILSQPSPLAAPALLGWHLRIGSITGVIAEVEAYHSEQDLACHAARGRTARTATLYGSPGTLYVYLCYGIHHMLNLVTDKSDSPSAVLIRGLIIPGVNPKRSNGPGKITSLLGIDQRHNKLVLGTPPCALQLFPPRTKRGRIHRGPRVGVAYAGPHWSAKPWRWWLSDFPVQPA